MDNTDLKVINLFGAPGSGKSKIAQLIAGLCFKYNENIQYVDEHAKKLCWEQSNEKRFKNQVLITAEQYTKQLLMRENNIKYCVTDSPILIGQLYCPTNYFESYNKLTSEMFSSFTNINFLITRGDFEYELIGRNENEHQSLLLHEQQLQLLQNQGIEFDIIKNDDAYVTAITILDKILTP